MYQGSRWILIFLFIWQVMATKAGFYAMSKAIANIKAVDLSTVACNQNQPHSNVALPTSSDSYKW